MRDLRKREAARAARHTPSLSGPRFVEALSISIGGDRAVAARAWPFLGPRRSRPTAPAAPPKASDIVPASILTKYGLDPNKLETSSKYEGDRWSVGYYPYDGNVQYVAFGKHKELFGNANAMGDAYSYWEGYGDSGMPSGSRIGCGTISEDDFEMATGVDITGDRPIANKA